MKRSFIVLLLISSVFMSCSKDKPTENTIIALVGAWEITAIEIDGTVINMDNYTWYWGVSKNVDLTFLENGTGIASATTDILYEYEFDWAIIGGDHIEFDAKHGLYGIYPYILKDDTLSLLFEDLDPHSNQLQVVEHIYLRM